MAKFSITVCLIFSLILAGLSLGLIFEELSLSTTDCDLSVTDVSWNMDCISQNFGVGLSANFFLVKLVGKLDPVSNVSYKMLLNNTSFDDSRFYSCDSQWRYIINIDPTLVVQQCKSLKPYIPKIILVLNEGSVKSLKISNVSKPLCTLNILSECPHLMSVIITNNFMSYFSELPSQSNNLIISLSLADNKISNITDGIFINFSSLTLLDLSQNLLTSLTKTLFDGVSTLEELDVSYNLIELISSDVFSNLTSLKVISLKNNNLKSIAENTFQFNNVLSVIDMSNNALQHIPPRLFYHAPHLKNISCSNCDLLTLDESTFFNSPNLVWMNFSYNHLQSLNNDMFKPLKFLEVVDLGHNSISNLNEDLFSNHPYLMYLNLSYNEILFLKTGVFSGAPNIRYLDLKKNNLKILTDDHIKNFTDLEYFGLIGNKLTKVELGMTGLVKIRKLDISHNNITKLRVIWKKLIFMETFNVNYNQLKSINLPPCIPNIKQTLTFSFKYNKIYKVDIGALISDEIRAKYDKTMAGCFFNGLAKNFIDLTDNPLMCDCKLFPFYNYARQKSPRKYQLDMLIDKNNLMCADPLFLRNNSLISLSDDLLSCPLTENCPTPCRCGIRGKDSLIFVNCSSLGLTDVPQVIPTGTTVLYANRNKISSMNSLNTKIWSNLSELHLDDNQLTDLNGWKIPQSLQYLSVRGNELKTFPQSLTQFISNQSDFQLYFGNNDKKCDCNRKTMKEFLLKNLQFVKDNEDIVCEVKSNGTSELLPLTSIPDKELCLQVFDVSFQKSLFVSLCVFFIILILLLLVYYKQRQLILSFFYIHCDEIFRLFYTEEDDDKIFDAFVAYSGYDREIVLELLKELETKPPSFKLCVHERNWLPGRFITENIVNSVEKSRRTIVILSNSFIQSPWFNIELRAAVFKMSKDKMNRIIVILADKSVSMDSIDPELRHVISRRTYLVWGERWFWQKLRYALPRKKASKYSQELRRTSSEITLID